jgi:hypothetical protein
LLQQKRKTHVKAVDFVAFCLSLHHFSHIAFDNGFVIADDVADLAEPLFKLQNVIFGCLVLNFNFDDFAQINLRVIKHKPADFVLALIVHVVSAVGVLHKK